MMAGQRRRSARGRRVASHPLTHLVAAFVVLALVQAFLVRLYQVPSESMDPTLETGDRILASRVAYVGAAPATGDVIVFQKPDGWGPLPAHGVLRTAVGWFGDVTGIGPGSRDALTKRVIGGPGQEVACCDAEGRVTVDGEPLDEPYVQENLPFEAGVTDCGTSPVSLRCFDPIEVPAQEYLVMGDHRLNSSDSVISCRSPTAPERCARFVPRDSIVGKVTAIVWPPSRVGAA